MVNVPNKPSDYVMSISICKQTGREGVYIHCRVCASAVSLCVRGSELEGGGAIIGSCRMILLEIAEVLFFVWSSRVAAVVVCKD